MNLEEAANMHNFTEHYYVVILHIPLKYDLLYFYLVLQAHCHLSDNKVKYWISHLIAVTGCLFFFFFGFILKYYMLHSNIWIHNVS